MSALPRDESGEAAHAAIDREAERSTIVVYPMQTVFAHRAWSVDSYALPVPPLLRALVRDGRQWCMAVRAALQRYEPPQMDRREFKAREGEYRALLRALMDAGPGSDEAGRLVLKLFGVARCQFAGCRAPYLRYSGRLRHCGEDCRRAEERWKTSRGLPRTSAPRVRLAACAVCGGPLAGQRLRYCGEACGRAGEAATKRGRRLRAKAASEGADHAI